MRVLKRFLPWAAILALLLMAVPVSVVSAQDVTVSVDAPAEVAPGSDFTARVNVTEVTNMDTFQLKLTYNNDVIQIIGTEGGGTGVTDGLIDSTGIPVAMWMFSPIGTPGTAFVLGNVGGILGVSGSGYLCEVHFTVVGDPGETSALTLSEGRLGNTDSEEIPGVEWLGTMVQVTAFDADFSADSGITGHPLEGIAGVTEFDFTDATTGGTLPYTAWDWDFGDTIGTSTLQNPSYTYPAAGSYNVSLTVTDNTPQESTETKVEYITVYDPLEAEFSADSGIAGHALEGVAGVTEFDFTDATTDGVLPYTYEWDFDNDATVDSTDENPSWTYPDAGTYTVVLTVTDDAPGASIDAETKVDYITVYETLDAEFSADSGIAGHPQEGYAGVTEFDFSDGSSGGIAPYTAWDWDFGDTIGTSALETPSYTYPAAGTYTVVLTVTDTLLDEDTETKVDYITVYATFDAEFSADSGIAGHALEGTAGVTEFDFTDATTGGIPPYTAWDWDFGDTIGTSALETPSYIYPAAGTYTVVLTVTDSLPGSDIETKVDYITVYDPVDAEFSADSGIVGYATSGYTADTSFDFVDESTAGLPPYTAWDWDFGDTIGTSALETPSYIYPGSGTYTVALTVTDSLLDNDTETKVEYLMVYEAGDANADGSIDMGDVTKVERIILEIDDPTLWADANQDGDIDMGDVTRIERIILGLFP